MMREGCERERWERTSFALANQASFAGAKNIKLQDFSKFKPPTPRFSKNDLQDMKAIIK